MNTTDFPRFVILLLTVLMSTVSYSQSGKEVVILYNSVPVLAEVNSDGSIAKIIKEDPEYLKGYVLKVQDYSQYVADIDNRKNNSLLPTKQSQSYLLESTEYNVIPFDKGFATLNDVAIEKLDIIVMRLKKVLSENVVVKTLATKEDALIQKNRANSIRTYFKIRGIDTSRVMFESLVGDIDADEVKIHFVY